MGRKIIPHPRFERVEYLVSIIGSAAVTGRNTSGMNLVEFYFLSEIDPLSMIRSKYYCSDREYPITSMNFKKCQALIEKRLQDGDISEHWHDDLLEEIERKAE